MSGRRVGAALLLTAVAGISWGAGGELNRAEEQYRRADYQGVLSTLLQGTWRDGAVHALIGKAYYMDGQYRNAVSYLQKAVSEDPGNSGYYDWLGKAYGRRAEESSLVTAYSYANKTRESFEKAVALDGGNVEALSDLFEYYLQAPGIAGGGVGKAEAIAARIGRVSEAEYHSVLSELAAKRKDIRTEESELRRARDAAPGDIGRVIDLASFLARQGRYAESDEAFGAAAQMAPGSPRLLFARAEAYIRSGRNLPQAKALLRQYCDSAITPDDPPRADAARLAQAWR